MCIQDWQIGRLIRSKMRLISFTGGRQRILERDKDRVAVSFLNDGTNQIFISTDPNGGDTTGFLLPGGATGGTIALNGATTGTLGPEVVTLTSANPVVSANYIGDISTGAVDVASEISGNVGLVSNPPWLHFTLKDFGDLPMQWWYAYSLDEGDALTVIEYILPEAVLHMTPDELRAIA